MRRARTDIQALRGFAVLLVVLYHLPVRLRAGYLGVDVFFVISGYLVTGIVADAIGRGDFSFADFYFRRAKRLVPPAYVAFLATAVASVALLSDTQLRRLAEQLLGAVTFTGNVALAKQTGYFEPGAELKPLLHVWSLAIEGQYYLLLPVSLRLCPRRFWAHGAWGLGIASLAWTIVYVPQDPSVAFSALSTRAWELAIGGVGALGPGPAGRMLGKLFWPAMVALLVLPVFPLGGPHPGLDALVVCTATLAILLRNHEGAERSHVAKALAWFGDSSYSLYLVHWPLIAFVNNAWFGEMPVWLSLPLFAISVAMARLLLRYVERPARRAALAPSPRPILAAFALSAVIVLVPIAALAVDGRGSRYETLMQPNRGLGARCDCTTTFVGEPECRTAEKPRILVWGDSHAMHLIPGIVETVGSLGVEQATMGSCGPLLGLAPTLRDGSGRLNAQWARTCISFNESVLAHVARAPWIEVVVLSSRFLAYVDATNFRIVDDRRRQVEPSADTALAGFEGTVRALRALGKRVLVLAPPPSADFNIGECIERRESGRWNAGPRADCSIPMWLYRDRRARVLTLLERLRREAGVPVVAFDDLLCTSMKCRTVIDGVVLYRDAGHFTREGSILVARRIDLGRRVLDEAN